MTFVNGKVIGLFFLGLGLVIAPHEIHAQSLISRQLSTSPSHEQVLPDVQKADRIELSLSQRQVSLVRDDQVLTQYPVAIGRPGWETPVGTFEIKTKIVEPGWKHPFEGYVIPSGDPNNPLGKRWMGFWTDGKNWVGFHGTSASMRASIGTAASHGCVRMFDEDIQSMYELVAVGTPVIVTP